MDHTRCDSIARAIAGAKSRRDVLRAFFVGSVAGVAAISMRTATSAAGKCRQGEAVCRKNEDCCTNECLPPDQFGRQRCSSPASPPPPPPPPPSPPP